MFFINLDKQERKKLIKIIEKHLKNYNNYKVAAINIKEQIERLLPTQRSTESTKMDYPTDSFKKLENELAEVEVLMESIERAVAELSPVEKEFIKYRYFNNWSINKSAMEIGYNDKALFTIRNQAMDKLIISMGGLMFTELPEETRKIN
ncbi:transcriptional regulator [Sediminibacillus dalangtanensis]|uniref:Transcriptional regulator n=1 Tax=Sediminibacillus dalangtanensis TaxID=2729421 RepID=A0ABX7VPN1_9BACI|nr:transcriptional regulator [Sediminibacillus dalangtanensis]QTM98438.1 transcriptional regulator [Sediminibacillus dalangtanensis]